MAQTVICECASSVLSSNYYITWVVIIFGWFIVNWQNNKRETRKEIRNQIDLFTQKLKSLEEDSILYHKNSRHDAELSKSIKRDLEYLIKLSRRLKLLDNIILNRQIIELRKSITFSNFDNPTKHQPQVESSSLLGGIYVSCDNFVDTFEQAYINKFH